MSRHGLLRQDLVNRCIAGVVAIASVICVGCGSSQPPTYPVQGTVRFADGQPVPVGTIEFRSQSDGRIAKGPLNQQGHFQLSTFHNNDGAVAGQHQVIVIQHFDPTVWSTQRTPDFASAAEHMAHDRTAGLVNRRFADYKTSELTVNVRPRSDNPIDLNVGVPAPLPNSKRPNR
jgi:hypothetical protein